MLVNTRTVELTQAFYDWELRGRGWATHPYPVVLEPPYRPFTVPGPASGRRRDDSRRPTLLSSLVDSFRSPPPLVRTEEHEPPDEPLPQPDVRSADHQIQEHLTLLPQEARVSRQAVLGWLRSLSTVAEPVSFEMLGGSGRVEVRLATDAGDSPHVLRQLRAALPAIRVSAAPETLEERWCESEEDCFVGIEFGLASEFMIPLAVFRPGDEPLLPLVAGLADLEDGELGLFQVLFKETDAPWTESLLRSVTTPSGQPFFADAPEITTSAKEKVSSPLFAVAIRIASSAPKVDRAVDIVRRIAGGLSHFGGPRTNELMPLATFDPAALETDLLKRSTHRSGMLLSAEELASLVHLPGAGVQVPELLRARERTKKAPAEVMVSGCTLGRNEHEGEVVEVALSVDAKIQHVHVVGGSGTGKSTLLVRMIVEDIEAGHGVGVLDPHGDLIDEVAARVPDSRISDVILFDPTDEEAVIGWNILGAQSEAEKDLLASDLVGVFRRLSTSWGDQMTSVLANAILVFLESERGGTLEDLRRFLIDESFRKEMLATVADSHIQSYWETEYSLLAGRRPQAPILTRLDTFLRSKLIRRVVTVREPKLDFSEVTDRGYIFLGKLAAGAIGEENAALLGSLLVSKFHQVTLAREAQAVEDRRPFFLYIDEFHQVATSSMASLFSGVRKYRLGLTVAHQDLYQLHRSVPEVERSLLANAYSRICFRVSDEDARQLEKGLGFFNAEDLMGLDIGEAICRVGPRHADFNLSTDRLEPLDPENARNRQEAIRRSSRERWGIRESDEHGVSDRTRHTATEDLRKAEEERAPRPEASKSVRAAPSNEQKSQWQPLEKPSSKPQLDKEELDYLHLVAAEPFLTIRERNRQLGLSAWKGERAKSELLRDGLVQEVAISPGGRGKRFKLLELTQTGRDLLATYRIKPASGHGRGGIAHQWWSHTIAGWLRGQGVEAKIEDDSQGARVDLSFSVRRKKIAVEIEMSDGHAVENIRKDLAAGFDAVFCLLDQPSSMERIQKSSPFGSEQSSPDVSCGDVRHYKQLLAPLIDSHSSPIRRPNQNKEPRGPRRRHPPRPGQRQATSHESLALSEPGVLTTPVAAEYLGLSPATLETKRSRGGGPVFAKLGRRVVYRREDLDYWIKEQRRRSTSDDGA
ncbi:MAG: type IV secretion system DNA-binding domain-containing protein [Acidobacteria bacterium]|nr:type IV secretion system DNA-binding domain-containing protein [Acidobacteriota bacterium]